MPEVDHALEIKILHISSHDICLLDKDRSSSDSLLNIPMFSLILNGRRSWEGIRVVEFIGSMLITIGVDILSFEVPLCCHTEGSHCRMVLGIAVDAVGADDFSMFCQEGGRDVLYHIKVATIDDCIDYVFL